MRWRIVISVIIGLASGAFCCFLLTHFQQGAGDFSWTIRAARYLWARQNPYDTRLEQYPLTAAFFGLPFMRMAPELAGGLFFGISSGLLAFGLTRNGYHRLLVFLAYPYWAAILTAQWSPLVMASAFFPLLLPATMAKPQIGLPVFLTHLSRRGVAACAILGVASLVVMPKWPLLWFGQFGYYEHFIPILILPGPLLLLALIWYRDRNAILLFLMALVPQRWFFDTLILWLIPRSRRQILVTALLSWGTGIVRWYHPPHSYNQVGRWTVLFIYLPMLVVVVLQNYAFHPAEGRQPSPAGRPKHG